MKRTPWTLFSVVMFFSLSLPAWAQDFYVIAVGRKLKNVVTVAKSGGQYTDVKTAIDSIGDASPDNPYLVYIGPGVYSVISQIQLKAHVTVMGSGREATLLRGAISSDDIPSSAIILGADNAILTQLSVENTGGSNLLNLGIYNSQGSPVLDKIAVNVSGATSNYGIYNSSSSPTMTNVTATGSGGTNNYGICNVSASPIIRDCTLKGTGYSIYTGSSSSPFIHNSLFDGSIGGSGNIYIANSRLNGGMEGTVTYHCIGNYGCDFQPVNCP